MILQEHNRVRILSLESSVGIHKYSRDLAQALGRMGYESTIASNLNGSRDCLIHPQLGNSTRSLWPAVSASRDSLVLTVHDVFPRNRLRRAWSATFQARCFREHQVVVHSRHSRDLLHRYGCNREIRVIPHGADLERMGENQRMKIRDEVGADGRIILISAGRIGWTKNCHKIFRLAENFPGYFFLFVGKIMDRRMRKFIDHRLPNIKIVESSTDQEFRNYICASDALLNFRTVSVGEVSGPVVMAHGVGTPVIGYNVGFMPEYCGTQDLLFPPTDSLERVFAALESDKPRLDRISEDSSTICSWDEAAKQYSSIYTQFSLER